MDNFVKITTGWVRQYFEPNEDGTFVCTMQSFSVGDLCEYENDGGQPIDPQIYQYQPYDMQQPGIITTEEILAAMERGKNKVKRIEAKSVPEHLRNGNAWLMGVNDIINRTGLAIRDEIECMKAGG